MVPRRHCRGSPWPEGLHAATGLPLDRAIVWLQQGPAGMLRSHCVRPWGLPGLCPTLSQCSPPQAGLGHDCMITERAKPQKFSSRTVLHAYNSHTPFQVRAFKGFSCPSRMARCRMAWALMHSLYAQKRLSAPSKALQGAADSYEPYLQI